MKLPEYYLMGMVFLYWFSPGVNYINPVAITLIAILILQAIFRNNVTGAIIGGLFLLANIFMLFALASEFSEFATINGSAVAMVVTGILIFGANIFMAGVMISKYTSAQKSAAPNNVSIQ
jgi:hypothetical protein